MFLKIFVLAASSLFSVGLLGLAPSPEPGQGPPPPPKRKGERPGPEDDLQKAYGLLRKLRAEIRANSHTEPRIRDWTDRAAAFYREGLEDQERGDLRLAHEHGAIAHDLARASDHAHNGMLYDRAEDDLPRPPVQEGVGEIPEPIRHDLRKTYDRLVERTGGPDAKFYRDAARDLYNWVRLRCAPGPCRLPRHGRAPPRGAAGFSGMLRVDEPHLGRFAPLLATDPLRDVPVAFTLVAKDDHEGRPQTRPADLPARRPSPGRPAVNLPEVASASTAEAETPPEEPVLIAR